MKKHLFYFLKLLIILILKQLIYFKMYRKFFVFYIEKTLDKSNEIKIICLSLNIVAIGIIGDEHILHFGIMVVRVKIFLGGV